MSPKLLVGRRSVRFQKPRWLRNASTWMPKLRIPWPVQVTATNSKTGQAMATPRRSRTRSPSRRRKSATKRATLGFSATMRTSSLNNRSSWVSWCWLMLLWWGSFLWVDVVFLEVIYCLFFTVCVKIRKHLFKGRCEDPSPVPHGWDEHGCSASKTFLRYRLPTFSLLEISYHV